MMNCFDSSVDIYIELRRTRLEITDNKSFKYHREGDSTLQSSLLGGCPLLSEFLSLFALKHSDLSRSSSLITCLAFLFSLLFQCSHLASGSQYTFAIVRLCSFLLCSLPVKMTSYSQRVSSSVISSASQLSEVLWISS